MEELEQLEQGNEPLVQGNEQGTSPGTKKKGPVLDNTHEVVGKDLVCCLLYGDPNDDTHLAVVP